MTEAIAAARRTGGSIAVMLMDLDRFKEINDTFGHQCGDQLLCEVADDLRKAVRDQDTVARLGGGVRHPGRARRRAGGRDRAG